MQLYYYGLSVVADDLVRAVRVTLRARARRWVKMDYLFCLLTPRLECIAARISQARLIAARFRAYSQGPLQGSSALGQISRASSYVGELAAMFVRARKAPSTNMAIPVYILAHAHSYTPFGNPPAGLNT